LPADENFYGFNTVIAVPLLSPSGSLLVPGYSCFQRSTAIRAAME
jgi:hypothetical protein